MADTTDTNPPGEPAQPAATPARPPFPAIRLLYAVGFGIVAWFVFVVIVAIAIAQYVVVAIEGRVNDELKHFSVNLVQYLWELMAFIAFARDELPFPLGPFPKQS